MKADLSVESLERGFKDHKKMQKSLTRKCKIEQAISMLRMPFVSRKQATKKNQASLQNLTTEQPMLPEITNIEHTASGQLHR